MRRGFKAEAKRLSLDVRDELGISAHEAMDPLLLATLYGIQVFSLHDLAASEPKLADALHHFTKVSPDVFSAAVLPWGNGRIIVENSGHERPRRASTLAHEMSHILLDHAFTTLLRTSGGECRESDRNQEDEAAELSGELLLPTEAARRMAYRNVSDEAVAAKFRVSIEFARWRMNSTGARLFAQRAKARTKH
ncbi:ImmA/IrrE family metallo-endopeptidase [Streptomyces sp. SID3212]|uniref:ImmA/IrrE family metallo-endopeptidase n=1 Tax=Streptomyces sp. SID3212 TaxID=2690259 RepID=UPI00136A6293|nr:ImmA/IrrE family metallo-endopeptidase [Streptomyces sp. SID3212]MYV52516.1 ImmA/IrrE family metallo-endopeptidase [Streptomyces sp. SID3212]